MIDLADIMPRKLSEFEISVSVESYDEKMLKITEIATLPKNTLFPNYPRYRFQIVRAQIVDLNEDSVQISRPYLFFREICRQRDSRSGLAVSLF